MPYLHLDLPGTYPIEVKRELASRLCCADSASPRESRRTEFSGTTTDPCGASNPMIARHVRGGDRCTLRMTFDVHENERKMSVYAGVFGLFNFAAVVAEMKSAGPVVATPVCGNHDRDAARRLVPGHPQCRRAHRAGGR